MGYENAIVIWHGKGRCNCWLLGGGCRRCLEACECGRARPRHGINQAHTIGARAARGATDGRERGKHKAVTATTTAATTAAGLLCLRSRPRISPLFGTERRLPDVTYQLSEVQAPRPHAPNPWTCSPLPFSATTTQQNTSGGVWPLPYLPSLCGRCCESPPRSMN